METIEETIPQEDTLASFEESLYENTFSPERKACFAAFMAQAEEEMLLHLFIQIHVEEANIEGMKELKKKTQLREERAAKRKENFRKLLALHMEQKGLSKLKKPFATFSLGKPREKLVIEDETQIDAEYFETVTQVKLKRKELEDHLKQGVVIEGAHLAEGERVLTIRI